VCRICCSLQATFLVSLEEGLLSRIIPVDINHSTRGEKIANSTLGGALVLHIFAAIISFVARFFLTRFELQEAVQSKMLSSGSAFSSVVAAQTPRLVAVGFFANRGPPVNLIRRCLILCNSLAASGFILAVVGIVTFLWEKTPFVASVFSSVCVGLCLILAVIGTAW